MTSAESPAPEGPGAAAVDPIGPPGRCLVVTAHPDDVDFGAGGTVAAHVAAGWQVAYCVCTDGDAGGFDEAVDRRQIPVIRRAEQTEAARLLGVTELHWLGHADGRLDPTIEVRRDISRVIRTVRPDRVVTHNPQRNLASIHGSHPDHLAAGEATLRAVYPDARNPFAYPDLLADGLREHAVAEVWLMGGPEADVTVDVTDHLDAKLAALRAHVSQETDRGGRLEPLLRERLGASAVAAGLGDGRLAEVFRRLDTR